MNESLDKNGKPLKGAALQSHLKKKFMNDYLESQRISFNYLSSDEKEILLNAALDSKEDALRKSKKRRKVHKALQAISASVAAGCLLGFLALMVRPNYWPVGLLLGFGFGGGMAISQAFDPLDDDS